MKWVTLIVTLMVGAAVLYYAYYGRKPTPGTPHATVQAYVDAAKKGDEAAIRSLCTAAAAQDAIRLAPQVRKMLTGTGLVALQAMKADPPRKGLCAALGARLLGFQLIQENGQWKIVEIGVTGE